MKLLIIPDSFKGTMSSAKVCGIIEAEIHTHFPQAQTVSIPVADGGEGSVDAFLTALGGERVTRSVKGPHFEQVDAYYGILPDQKTAVIEMAQAAGLPLAGDRLSPGTTTTYGVGELMAHAISRGCTKLIVGLGGSATNEFGCGAAAAMGVKFFDAQGDSFIPTGETLSKVQRIDTTELSPALEGIEVITMCDIDNPLYGETGAAYVFSPQKGADPQMVRLLDAELRAISETVKRDLSVDVSGLPGAGAAGGMGGGMVAFFGSKLQMGIETVLDVTAFDELLCGADLVITGEGKLDRQSLGGKVVIGVARRAKKQNVPVVALVGDIGDDIEDAYAEGVSAIFSINRVAVPFAEAKLRSREDLALTAGNLMRFLKRIGFPL